MAAYRSRARHRMTWTDWTIAFAMALPISTLLAMALVIRVFG